jgi:hypothetical protein
LGPALALVSVILSDLNEERTKEFYYSKAMKEIGMI